MGGDGAKHGPHVWTGLLQTNGETLEHRVEGEGKHREEVSEEESVNFLQYDVHKELIC